jgi:predicted GNAT family N-acyltransferase
VSVAISAVGDRQRSEVEAFYQSELGRDPLLAPDQELFVAGGDDEIVAALRLCPEAGTLLLRTDVVAKGRRGEGIGRALLLEASRAIGDRECWCFPWSYLERFYAEIGLARISDERVPVILRGRIEPGCVATYRRGSP